MKNYLSKCCEAESTTIAAPCPRCGELCEWILTTKDQTEKWTCPCGKPAEPFECCSKECDKKYSMNTDEVETSDELEDIIKLVFPAGMKLSTLDGDSRDVETRLRDLFEKVRKEKTKNTDDISDGYHTFGELYEHKITLFIALCKQLYGEGIVWRSKLHSDGSSFEGRFILGMNQTKGRQITYHLPLEKWEETDFAQTLKKAPEFDGHTSEDVLKRIKKFS